MVHLFSDALLFFIIVWYVGVYLNVIRAGHEGAQAYSFTTWLRDQNIQYGEPRQCKYINTGTSQVNACNNRDFHWPFTLVAALNGGRNRSGTARSELRCTSAC
jgi:hypothetical protein